MADELPPGALMGWATDDCHGRDRLGVDRRQTLQRFEGEPAAPESWQAALCSCGRCDGRGRLRIHTDGAEEWVLCDSPGGTRYDPKAAAGDWWKS